MFTPGCYRQRTAVAVAWATQGKVHCHRAQRAAKPVVADEGAAIKLPLHVGLRRIKTVFTDVQANPTYRSKPAGWPELTVYGSESPVVGVLHMASRRHGGLVEFTCYWGSVHACALNYNRMHATAASKKLTFNFSVTFYNTLTF